MHAGSKRIMLLTNKDFFSISWIKMVADLATLVYFLDEWLHPIVLRWFDYLSIQYSKKVN